MCAQRPAWVYIGIINGLEDMFRIQIPVLDIYGSLDWSVTIGADERRMQILRIPGSRQVMVDGMTLDVDGNVVAAAGQNPIS